MQGMVLVALGVVLMGCGSGMETPQERLLDTWIVFNDTGTRGVGLTFRADNTYAAQKLQLTSSNTADDEVETGIYSATETNILFTPQKYSCPGPDAVYTLSYSFNGAGLSIVTSSGIVFLEPDTASTATNAVLTFGCFQTDGTFVASPLLPVGN